MTFVRFNTFSSSSSEDECGSSEPANTTLLFFWLRSFCFSILRGCFGVSGTIARACGVVTFGVVGFTSKDGIRGLLGVLRKNVR